MLSLGTILKTGAIGGLGALSIGRIIELRMKEYNTNILEPIDTVSIIMAGYNEADFIGTALSSLRNQSIIQQYPEFFELIVADSCSTDGTIDIATQYADRVIITSKGKLTTRNEATDQANGNIVVSVDADTYYPYHWLNNLLEPFNDLKDPSIIAVSGGTFDYTVPNVPDALYVFSDTFYNYIFNKARMVGRNSAYWKHSFYLADRFDENVDQFNIWTVFREEEKLFGQRLSKFGKVIYKLNASCYHLGGFKSIGRWFKTDKKLMDKYQFGKDRF